MSEKRAPLLFADAVVDALEAKSSLPAKLRRMLKRMQLGKRVADKNVAIKMHLGWEIGYTTISPVFVRALVEELLAAGAASVKIIDGKDPAEGIIRGYTREIIGAPVVNCFGHTGKYLYPEKIGFGSLDEALFGGEAVDCDFFIDLAHVKGHGACGFGGALKNIAMGTVPHETRGKIHQLEGGLVIDMDKCKYCLKCYNNCPNEAIIKDDEKKEISFFFHHCTYCQHCVMICPENAITMENRTFDDFAKGMAMVTGKFLEKFAPEDTLFINFLTNITIYCDCWGFSTPSLVPDIGILMGDDIAAIDTASLDMIKTENLIPAGLPKGRELIEGDGHLFERIHGKDPYLMISLLQDYHSCTTKYDIQEVK